MALGSLAGSAIGYLSTAFYLGSRVSQIFKNWQRGSAEVRHLPCIHVHWLAAAIQAGMCMLQHWRTAATMDLPWQAVGVDDFVEPHLTSLRLHES